MTQLAVTDDSIGKLHQYLQELLTLEETKIDFLTRGISRTQKYPDGTFSYDVHKQAYRFIRTLIYELYSCRANKDTLDEWRNHYIRFESIIECLYTNYQIGDEDFSPSKEKYKSGDWEVYRYIKYFILHPYIKFFLSLHINQITS